MKWFLLKKLFTSMDDTPSTTSSTPTTPTTSNPTPPRPWRRVFVSVLGIILLLVSWRWAVNHLYTLPEHSISSFTSITTSLFYTISVVVVFLVTGLTFFSWTQSSSVVANIAEQINKTVSETITKTEGENKKP